MRAGWVVVIACVACSRPKTDEPGTCLPLPASVRSRLTADPDGDALYWLESVTGKDFDAQLTGETNLVRYDFHTRRVATVLGRVAGPLLFMRDKIIALRPLGRWRVVQIDDDGTYQELTPEYLDVLDIEPLDDHTLALLADGDGRRAVYILDLDSPRPEYLVDAGTLLSTSAGRIYIREGDDTFVVDPHTRRQTKIAAPKKLVANADGAVHVTAAGTVAVQSMSTGMARTVVLEPRRWKLVHQVGSVLARTPPKHNSSFAWLLSAGESQELPTILGGASILSTALLRGQTWALIGHNTTNYIGDLADTRVEADVCLLPAQGNVTFATRQVPARFQALGDPLWRKFEQLTDNATLQILESSGLPTTVFIRFSAANGARDWPAMRKRASELHAKLTSTLGNREIKTELLFADGQTAVLRWRRQRLRARPSVGMGDALLNEPEDFDVESRNLVNDAKDGRIRCSGTLVNVTARQLADVTLRCSTNRKHVIHLGTVAPHASAPFDQSFEIKEGEEPLFEVFVAGSEAEVRDPDLEARMQAVLDIAITVQRDTGLVLDEHDVEKDGTTVYLTTGDAFESRAADARKAAIEAAYRSYEGLRAIYGLEPASPITLRVAVELTEVTYTFDGTKLTRDD